MYQELKVFCAAVYLVADDRVYRAVFDKDDRINFRSRTEALECVRSAASMSENQRTALYSYLLLYVKLTDRNREFINNLVKTLKIKKGVENNAEEVMSDTRIEYIRERYKTLGQGFEKVFKEPENFIIDMIDEIAYMPVIEEKKRLRGLRSAEYEHPLDKTALEALKSNQGIKPVMTWINDYAVERAMLVRLTGSSFKVTEDSIPYLFNAVNEVCDVLDIRKVPEIYINDIGLNAYTSGIKLPVLVLGSACMSLLTHEELMFIIGHELGHIKSEHVLYHQFAQILPIMGKLIGNATLGVGQILSDSLVYALMEWYRKSELTADRAGLLACQNPDAAFTVMTKLAGFPMKYYGNIDTKYILEQARSFEDLDSDTYNKITKVISVLSNNHPWTVMRAKELDRWIESGAYKAVINRYDRGDYYRGYTADSPVKIKFKS